MAFISAVISEDNFRPNLIELIRAIQSDPRQQRYYVSYFDVMINSEEATDLIYQLASESPPKVFQLSFDELELAFKAAFQFIGIHVVIEPVGIHIDVDDGTYVEVTSADTKTIEIARRWLLAEGFETEDDEAVRRGPDRQSNWWINTRLKRYEQ